MNDKFEQNKLTIWSYFVIPIEMYISDMDKYIWVTLKAHNILASRREQNHISNRTSAHLKEKNIIVLIYFP